MAIGERYLSVYPIRFGVTNLNRVFTAMANGDGLLVEF